MKIALCTTTIHVPHALALLRKCSPDEKFFIATDEKTPQAAYDFISAVNNAEHYYHGDGALWKCSWPIGFNTIARRNIAFLEALKWGADVVYSWDDDNLPVDKGHFNKLDVLMSTFESGGVMLQGRPLFNGIQVGGYHWFDPGSLLVPPTRHRGYPHDMPRKSRAEPITDAKIGVAAGLVIGDPDIDASTRIEHRPDIGGVHLLGQTGVVVDLNTHTVFNSQNTAVIRGLVPAWFMMPGVGRHDDIYASLIVQRVAREQKLHVHFGPPFTYQQRHKHNLVTDLRAEIDGMENVTKLADLLDAIILKGRSTVEDTRTIYQTLLHCDFLPTASVEAGLAWLEDIESIGI